jgi:predicted GNAT family acetyltransferase
MNITVKREETEAGGRYVTRVGGVESEMTFTRARRAGQNLMIIDHTGVPSALSVMLQRHKDWQDVLAA